MLTRMCCVCHKIEQEGEWLFASSLSENALLTHGYCPSCFAEAMAEVEDALGSLPMVGMGSSNWSTMRGA